MNWRHLKHIDDDLKVAVVLWNKYRWERVKASFCERMVRLAPNDPEPLAKLAWARWEIGRKADAIAIWRRARALSPSHPAVRRIGRLLRQN